MWRGDFVLLLYKAIPFLPDFDLDETADLLDSEESLESTSLERGLDGLTKNVFA